MPRTLLLLSALAVVLWPSAECWAQGAPTPPRPQPVPQDPALIGVWELVNGPLRVPRDDVDMAVDAMRLVVRPSDDGDSLSVHSFEIRLSQEGRTDGVRDESDATSRCALLDSGAVTCRPSHEGTRMGWWHLGPYAFDGDTLVFDDPASDFDPAFRRVGGAE